MAARFAGRQEEDEADYQRTFQDHFAAFEDVAAAEGEVVMAGDEEAANCPAPSPPTAAQAASAAVASLLGGQALRTVVTLHARSLHFPLHVVLPCLFQ